MHGFAFNVNADLSYFNHIIPCGITDKAVTSMHLELGKTLDIDEVKTTLKNHLAEVFELEWVEER
jgi:lipoyl(octanoyl) transferase